MPQVILFLSRSCSLSRGTLLFLPNLWQAYITHEIPSPSSLPIETHITHCTAMDRKVGLSFPALGNKAEQWAVRPTSCGLQIPTWDPSSVPPPTPAVLPHNPNAPLAKRQPLQAGCCKQDAGTELHPALIWSFFSSTCLFSQNLSGISICNFILSSRELKTKNGLDKTRGGRNERRWWKD